MAQWCRQWTFGQQNHSRVFDLLVVPHTVSCTVLMRTFSFRSADWNLFFPSMLHGFSDTANFSVKQENSAKSCDHSEEQDLWRH